MKKKTLLIYYILFISFTFSQTQIGSDINGKYQSDRFGTSVSVSSDGNIIIVGAPNDRDFGNGSGIARIYQNKEGIWTQVGEDIKGSGFKSRFGIDVSISSNGKIVAIASDHNSGKIRVYQNINNVWTQVGEAINQSAPNGFGRSVSLSSDGNIIAIGHNSDNDNGTVSGKVQIFKNINNVWTQIGQDIKGNKQGDLLGSSTSLSSDGNVLAIGAKSSSIIYSDGSSYVRIFKNINDVWTQVGEDIKPEASHFSSHSGASVSLSSDGNIIAIGAPRNTNENGITGGHVRVYKNINDVWTQIGQDIDGTESFKFFGESVSLSSDGNIVAIGEPYAGNVHIFVNENNVWVKKGNTIHSSVGKFGESVSLSSDGSIVVIGSSFNSDNGNRAGQVRVYSLSKVLSVSNFVSENISLFPNPIQNSFIIRLKENLSLKNVDIYNTLGKKIITTNKKAIITDKLPVGLYFVEITTDKGKAIKKLIKK